MTRTWVSLAGVDSSRQVAGTQLDVSVEDVSVATTAGAVFSGDGRHGGAGQHVGQLAVGRGVAPAGDDTALGQLGRRVPLGDTQRLDLPTVSAAGDERSSLGGYLGKSAVLTHSVLRVCVWGGGG